MTSLLTLQGLASKTQAQYSNPSLLVSYLENQYDRAKSALSLIASYKREGQSFRGFQHVERYDLWDPAAADCSRRSTDDKDPKLNY